MHPYPYLVEASLDWRNFIKKMEDKIEAIKISYGNPLNYRIDGLFVWAGFG
jgi:hypothetical protein